MWVGPKRVMTGTSNPVAKWRGPESVVTSRADRRMQALVRPRPERFVRQADDAMLVPAWATIERAASRSPGRRRPGRRRRPRRRVDGPGWRNGLVGPALGRPERPAGVQADDRLEARQGRVAPRRGRRRASSAGGGVEFEPEARRPGQPSRSGDLAIGVDDRRGPERPRASRRGIKRSVSSHPRPPRA